MSQAQSFDLQGHRGCRGLFPENTIPAFIKALELGVQTLEMDVVISKDHQVVVSHEPYFNAAFSSKPDGTPVSKAEEKSLRLYEMPYEMIRRYDTGKRGNASFPEQQKMAAYKPLLTEVIAAAEAYAREHQLPAPRYNIELKSEEKEYNRSQPEPAAFCELVYAILEKQVPPERLTIQSFDFNILRFWKTQEQNRIYRKVQLSALVTLKGVKRTVRELGFRPDIFSPAYKLVNAKNIRNAHDWGVKVIPWTVNDPETMEHLQKIGVDGLITDYPNRFKK